MGVHPSKQRNVCLPQVGSLGHDLLEQRLNKQGYNQRQIIPGLWKHKNQSIMFTLVVDDFGIKYMTDKDLDHIIKMLQKYDDVQPKNVKIDLDWDYKNRCIYLSMAPYLKKALRQFRVKKPKKLQNSPYAYTPPPSMEQRNNMWSKTMKSQHQRMSKLTCQKHMQISVICMSH
ncbi:hypothetical protein ACHAW6_013560 [Cyclotella cf. meneghiniana]